MIAGVPPTEKIIGETHDEGFFSQTFSKVKSFFTSIGNGIYSGVSYVGSGFSNLVGTIHSDARDYFGGVKEIIKGGETSVTNVGNSLGNLGMPLAIGAGILGAAILLKK